MISLSFYLQPKQALVLDKIEKGSATFVAFGGSRGGGKSGVVRAIAQFISLKYAFPVLIFRRLREELLENHIYKMLQEQPELNEYYHKQEMTLFDPRDRNKILIKFGYAEMESDIYKFQGKEYGLICIDEATQMTWDMITFLKTSNRTTSSGSFIPKLLLTMNPGGVGHAEIKRLFIDRIFRENERPDDYDFVQSSVWDNAIWCKKLLDRDGYTYRDYYAWSEEKRINYTMQSDYAMNLQGLDEERRKAYLFGDWDVYGGLFFKGFDSRKEIIDPFEIPKEWKLYAGIDPGFSSPCVFQFIAVDPAGNFYVIYTYSEQELNAYDHAERIKELIYSEDGPVYKITKGRKPITIVAGLDAWAKKDRYAILANEKTFNDAFIENGLVLSRAVTDRVNGWRAIKTLMPDRLFFFKEYTKPTINEILSVESDKRNVEDISGRGNDPDVSDHCLDALRYTIMSAYRPKVYQPEHKVYPNSRERAAIIHQTPNPIASF